MMAQESKLTQMLLTTMITSANMKWSSFLSPGGIGRGRDKTTDEHDERIIIFYWLFLAWMVILFLFLLYRRLGQGNHAAVNIQAKEVTILQDHHPAQQQNDHYFGETDSITDDDDDEFSLHKEEVSDTVLPASPIRSNATMDPSLATTTTTAFSSYKLENGLANYNHTAREVVETERTKVGNSNLGAGVPDHSLDYSSGILQEDVQNDDKLLADDDDELVQKNYSNDDPNKIVFEGWLSKQSRFCWQNRYFEIYQNGNVTYYPKGVSPNDSSRRYAGVRLYHQVSWSKTKQKKLELKCRTNQHCQNDDTSVVVVVGKVKLPKKNKNTIMPNNNDHSLLEDWLVKGNSWLSNQKIVGLDESS